MLGGSVRRLPATITPSPLSRTGSVIKIVPGTSYREGWEPTDPSSPASAAPIPNLSGTRTPPPVFLSAMPMQCVRSRLLLANPPSNLHSSS